MEREQLRWPGYLYNYKRTSNHPAGDSNTTTLGSVLNIQQTSSSSSRTLLDIIQADSTGESKNTWTYFREKLAATSTTLRSELQRADNSMNNPIPAEEETPTGPMRMSLMALLAETEGEMGLDKSGSGSASEDKNVVDEYTSNCIVCMMRHKGAAFIPCGHTFCRLCSKELYAQRGNCPLCNAYVSEILHIF